MSSNHPTLFMHLNPIKVTYNSHDLNTQICS